MSAPLTLVGAPGSPYSRKMRALLRYRRLAHRWVIRNSRDDPGGHDVPVALIPVLRLPGPPAETLIDSTFQIRRLEELFPERSVVPTDPAVAFLDFLVEDYADEWLTKAMFHYRWSFAPDVEKAGKVLPLWSNTTAPDEMVARFTKMITERQVGRRGIVGINETTAPIIEESYRRLLRALDAHLSRSSFVTGERPGSADFALLGQLSQLLFFEPTSQAIAVQEAPRVIAWCEVMEDLSGLERAADDWITADALAESARPLFAEIGRTYAPFLLANAAALEDGAKTLRCSIAGRPFEQPPFRYQGRCLGWLREAYTELDPESRGKVDAALAGSGCETLFA